MQISQPNPNLLYQPPMMVAAVLEEIIQKFYKNPVHQNQVTIFHATKIPSVTITQYIERIIKYSQCSSSCYIIALIYIDRVIERHPTFTLNPYNIHRLLISSILLAAKFYDDFYFDNDFYSQIGGIKCNEMNALEVEFLRLINFKLFVSPALYQKYFTELQAHIQKIYVQMVKQQEQQLLMAQLYYQNTQLQQSSISSFPNSSFPSEEKMNHDANVLNSPSSTSQSSTDTPLEYDMIKEELKIQNQQYN